MKVRETPYVIVPTHKGTGATAPGLHIYADSWEKARREAESKSTLFKRFSSKWMLV